MCRGIDIDDIRLVINFDVPHDSEDYVHRIGRTARANNDGVAITFVNEKEQTNFKHIENFTEKIYIRSQYHRNWAKHRRISRVILGQGMAIGHEIFVKEEERDQVEIDQKVENSPFLFSCINC